MGSGPLRSALPVLSHIFAFNATEMTLNSGLSPERFLFESSEMVISYCGLINRTYFTAINV
jgi:hypothetical protein